MVSLHQALCHTRAASNAASQKAQPHIPKEHASLPLFLLLLQGLLSLSYSKESTNPSLSETALFSTPS